jgi:hypothetical protein
MKKTINLYDFERAFVDMNRAEQFSYEGKKALFEYLEQYEEDTGEDIELDVIGLCCDYAEYDNLDEFQRDYSTGYKTLDDIRDETTVIEIEGTDGFIIQQF